ncbi:conserved hypothetical protein [Streptomyces sviceus ATCC 29083]|uniref:Uncharacterized protein n=1 Tax=Streptomyces sviceus (strain ATCC 29083 / DSM 924 / JCM 4929 / NBRC 13980 / NCIMB 11184 / NRRL 5439 / UC 5370) TaxID=463191 RepID=B5I5Z0_STRX2|nr:conserved hypothetical protein [Streptomyces sviceus ATCC 29083]
MRAYERDFLRLGRTDSGRSRLGALPAIRPRIRRSSRMSPVEYKPERPRNWIRDILVGVAASLGSDLVRALVQAAVHLLG